MKTINENDTPPTSDPRWEQGKKNTSEVQISKTKLKQLAKQLRGGALTLAVKQHARLPAYKAMRGYYRDLVFNGALRVRFCHCKNTRHYILACGAVRRSQQQHYGSLIELSVIPLSRAILGAHYLPLVPVKTRWLRFDFEPPSPNRSLEPPFCPFIFPLAFREEAGPRHSLQRRGCITSDSCQRWLRLGTKKDPGNCALITLVVPCADYANTLRQCLYMCVCVCVCEAEEFQDYLSLLYTCHFYVWPCSTSCHWRVFPFFLVLSKTKKAGVNTKYI